MSTRVRVLFRNGLEGSVAHVGKHAIAAMERLIASTETALPSVPVYLPEEPPSVWNLPYGYTSRRKEARRKKDVDPSGMLRDPLKHPELSRVSRAISLWQLIPKSMQAYCNLYITREDRKHSWKKSLANPKLYGWYLKQVKKSGNIPNTPSAPDASAISYAEAVAALQAAHAELPTPGASSGSVAGLTYTFTLPTFGSTGGEGANPGANPSTKKPGKAQVLKKTLATHPAGKTSTAGTTPGGPGKPKLKIGIWA